MYYKLIPNNPIPGVGPQGWSIKPPCTVGRSVDSQVCIDDESISRSHCQLFLGPDESLQVRDLGSLNGTYVNGEKIRKVHSLSTGDSLQVGSIIVRVEYASDTNPGIQPSKQVSSPTRVTQPMKILRPEQLAHQPPSEPDKKWWEFWK